MHNLIKFSQLGASGKSRFCGGIRVTQPSDRDAETDQIADGLVNKQIRNPEPDTSIYHDGFDPHAGVADIDKALNSDLRDSPEQGD
jgi:hypothetical protein